MIVLQCQLFNLGLNLSRVIFKLKTDKKMRYYSNILMLFCIFIRTQAEIQNDRYAVRESDPFEMDCKHKFENVTRVRWQYISTTQANTSETIFDSQSNKILKNGFEISCQPHHTFISTCLLKVVRARKEDSGKYICYVGKNSVSNLMKPVFEIELVVRGPKHVTMVVNNGDSVILPCEHNVMNLTRARWSHVSLQGVMNYQLYYMDWKKASNNNYEGLCEPHQPSCNLKILQTNKESAGRYICMVGESLEFEQKYGMFQMTYFIEIELVVGEMVCSENMNKDLTLIGENDCYGIEADVLNLKCSFNYFGNINYNILHLRWIEKYKFNSLEKKLNSSLINHEVKDETNKISIQTNLSIAYEMQNSIFQCVLEDTLVKPCQLHEFRTQYVKNTTARSPSMHSNDLHNVKCSANRSENVQCSYYWVHEIAGAMVENPYAILPVENMNSPGNYICIAKCHLGKNECIIKAMEFEVLQRLEAQVTETPTIHRPQFILGLGLLIGFFLTVCLIVTLARILWLTFKDIKKKAKEGTKTENVPLHKLATFKRNQAPNRVNCNNDMLPPYDEQNPRLWFGKVESIFRTQGIEDEILKYSYIVLTLPNDIAKKVEDLICNIPVSTSYNKMKEALVKSHDIEFSYTESKFEYNNSTRIIAKEKNIIEINDELRKGLLQPQSSVIEKVEPTNLNLPPFFDDPRIWFGKVEALFRTREINDEVQMHAYLVQILSELAIVISENAQDLISEMPKSKPYKKLKKAILEGCEQFDAAERYHYY